MTANIIKFTVLIFLILVAVQSHAQVTIPKILGNNMVLQRNQPVPVWGSARAGEVVSVDFNKQHKSVTADASGRWRISLDEMPANSSPQVMVIQGTNTIRLENILIGEVWLCSGQSNMEYSMRKNSKVILADSGINSPVRELERANNSSIRVFLVTSKNLRSPDASHSGWSIAKDSALRAFSAAGYFFGKQLFEKLGIPVGVISSAVPGSAIEPWLNGRIDSSKAGASNDKAIKINRSEPGKFFQTMIQPLTPFALKGFLWYQGETNCFQNETVDYSYKMQVLIEGWRSLWSDQNLPFYYVQIAPFYYSKSAGKYPLTGETLPRFWEAQQAVLDIPHTGMITITDLVASPDDLHPGFKWEVGRRLALLALAKTYQRKIISAGPVFRKMKLLPGKVELYFDNATGGLVSNNGKPLSSFLIAGEDGDFVVADAVISGETIIVSAGKISHPTRVRFEWNEAGQANLFNMEGLPAVPFRTDNPLHFQPKKILEL